MKTALAFLLGWFVLGGAAITFPGGHMPHSVDVGNGETVIAYTNGIVYTGAGDHKRTLWQKSDGSIMSSFPIIGGYHTYMVVELPATPQEVAKWRRAQDFFAEKKGIFRI